MSYANAPGGVLPYMLMLDRASKSVVLAVRGTGGRGIVVQYVMVARYFAVAGQGQQVGGAGGARHRGGRYIGTEQQDSLIHGHSSASGVCWGSGAYMWVRQFRVPATYCLAFTISKVGKPLDRGQH